MWTTPLPANAFQVHPSGRRASLWVRALALVDTLQFGGALAIPAQVDVSLQWHTTSRQVAVGAGASADPTAREAFEGSFAPATCVGRAAGRELGFSFATDTLTAERFFAELGTERNGTFLQ